MTDMTDRDTLPHIAHTIQTVDGYEFTHPHVPSIEDIQVIRSFIAEQIGDPLSREARRVVERIGTAAATSYGARSSTRHTVETYVPIGPPFGLVRLTARKPDDGLTALVGISWVH